MGRIDDASPRLREALATADVVAAEDTRRAKALAAGLGVTIGGRVVSYYDQVEVKRTPAQGVRGEITVVLDGAVAGEPDIDALVARVEEVVAGGVRLKDACAQFAAKTGASRRELYEAVLASREN